MKKNEEREKNSGSIRISVEIERKIGNFSAGARLAIPFLSSGCTDICYSVSVNFTIKSAPIQLWKDVVSLRELEWLISMARELTPYITSPGPRVIIECRCFRAIHHYQCLHFPLSDHGSSTPGIPPWLE